MTAPSYSSTYPYPYPLMTAPLPPSPEPSQSPQENLQEHPSPSSHDPAPMHDTQASTPPATTPSTPAEAPQGHRCLWLDCTQTYVDPEALYNHLCNDHIGRKSTNNLCLTCKWKDCGTTCAKRDHITSHLRVHTPLKPHTCEICKKAFKRPQDLKKHEKIHTEEHHAQHKHSKAITVVDPAYVQRVRGDPGRSQDARKSLSVAPPALKVQPGTRSKSHPSPTSDGTHFGVLPTPSPELGHASVHSHVSHHHQDMYIQNQQLPSWEVLRPDAASQVSTGHKRSHDFTVDEFFSDVKKRKVTPAYDPRMADRLNHLAYNHPPAGTGHHVSNFNPRSVSLDIRTPEELAAVNEFLVTLGRDVAGVRQHHQSANPNSGGYSPDTYFDSVSFSQLGIAGMPGLSPVNTTFTNESQYPTPPNPPYTASYHGTRSSHPSVQPTQYSPMYSNVHDSPVNYSPPGDYGGPRRHPSKFPTTPTSFTGQHYHHPTPPLDTGSPHSAVSTPINSTPPQVSLSIADTFDYMRPPRPAPPVAQLAPVDHMARQLRHIIPLKTAPTSSAHNPSRPEPVEPKVPAAVQRTPVKLTPSAASSSTISHGSLYPLLTSGDVQYRLPPLNKMYRSPSPPSRESTPSSTHSSPLVQTTVLPSLRSITDSAAFSTSPNSRGADSEELSKEIGRIELENRTQEIHPDVRRGHAELIRNLLVTINLQYKERFGNPPSLTSLSPTIVDVEMVPA